MTKKVKTEEEIREEVKKEISKENEIKEQTKKEIEEQQKLEKLKEYNSKNKRKKVFKIIGRIVSLIIIIFLLFEVIMGILNMQRLNDDKEPLWYFDSKEEVVDDKKETTYNLGLFVIQKIEDKNEKKIVLKPFFLK